MIRFFIHFAVIIKHDTYQSFPGEGRLWIPLALKQVDSKIDSRRCVVSVLSSASYAGYARDAGSVIAAGHCSCQHGTLITRPD